MVAPIIPADVIDSIERPLDADEVRVLPTWIDQAWGKLRDGVPGVEDRMALAPGQPAHIREDVVRDVLVAAVERKVRNPGGLRQWNADSFGQTIDTELSSGKIYITDEELARFRVRGAEPTNGGMFVITMGTP